jgi:hypothetical protein
MLEGADVEGTVAGFGGLILDNTAAQIASAQTQYDLNIIWDSRTDLLWNLNTTSSITASCPPNTTSLGTSSCSPCLASGSTTPCGDCLDCFNGVIYNGYVVDKGDITLKGRGPGGIVNIDSNQWKNYIKTGKLMTPLIQCNLFNSTLTQQKQLDNLKNQIDILANKIENKNRRLVK